MRNTSNNRPARNQLLYAVIAAASIITVINKLVLVYYVERQQVTYDHQDPLFIGRKSSSLNQDKLTIQGKSPSRPTPPAQYKQKQEQSEIAGLSCDKYGGPLSSAHKNFTSEMVYWHDIPSDAEYVSPYRHHYCSSQRNKKCETKYISYELEEAGWNNRRMGLEIMIAMALATGRTLVLPPRSVYPLMTKDWWDAKGGAQSLHNDFFPLDLLHKEYKGLNIISMEEFLEREAVTGNLMAQNSTNGTVTALFPPKNRTHWNESTFRDGTLEPLLGYLRNVGHVPMDWNPIECAAAIAAKPGNASAASLQIMMDEILREQDGQPTKKSEDFHGKTVPVDAPPKERLRNMLADRKRLCVYDEKMQNSKLLHFDVNMEKGRRVFGHFYTFFFFEDWKVDLLVKRMIRDHVRYRDEIMCAAARIVAALKERSISRNRTAENVDNGVFDSFHIRRGDFIAMYTFTDIPGRKIYERTKDVLEPNTTVYIATDEKDKSFFKPLQQSYDVCFLDDFKGLLKDVNPAFYGMVDQLVAARARTFVGVFFSTYTGYINRLRGYYSWKEKSKGYEDGILKSYYYTMKHQKNDMRVYHSLYGYLWAREFPTAWVDIDKGIIGSE